MIIRVYLRFNFSLRLNAERHIRCSSIFHRSCPWNIKTILSEMVFKYCIYIYYHRQTLLDAHCLFLSDSFLHGFNKNISRAFLKNVHRYAILYDLHQIILNFVKNGIIKLKHYLGRHLRKHRYGIFELISFCQNDPKL